MCIRDRVVTVLSLPPAVRLPIVLLKRSSVYWIRKTVPKPSDHCKDRPANGSMFIAVVSTNNHKIKGSVDRRAALSARCDFPAVDYVCRVPADWTRDATLEKCRISPVGGRVETIFLYFRFLKQANWRFIFN